MTAQWDTPVKEWEDNTLVSADDLNTEIRDRMEYLFQMTQPVIIQDQKAQNTAGGTFTSGAWRTRDLNVEVADAGNYATVAANQISLAAGTWLCIASAPAHQVDRHQTRLQNITDGATLLTGSGERSHGSDGTQTRSFITGVFTLAATKTLELQHQCQTTSAGTSGFGQLFNITTEVYSQVILIKIA